MCGRRRGACVPVPSVAKSQDPGARRAARAQGRKTVVRKDRTSPSIGHHCCSTGFVSWVPLFPEKHRGEDTHGKHGAHGHGSQLGGTVSNKVSKCRNTVRCVQVAQASKFLQVAIWVYLKGLPEHLARHLALAFGAFAKRLRVSPRDQGPSGCLLACLLASCYLAYHGTGGRASCRDDNLSRT